MNILVTGGTGFIGEHFIPELLKEGHNVRLLVRNLKKAKKLFGDTCEYFVADVTDTNSLKGCCDNIDIVYHMVAKVGNELPSEKNYYEFKLINVIGTKNIMEEAKRCKIKKFIFISSIAAMGIVDECPISEKSLCKPYLPYQVSKYEAEKLLNEEFKKSNFPIVCVRPTKVYGVGEHEFSFLKLSKMCKKGFFIKISKRDSYISNIYISDFVAGLISTLHNGKIGETYILTSKSSICINDVCKIISNTLKRKVILLSIPEKILLIVSSLQERIFIKMGKIPIVTKKNIESMCKNRIYDISKAITELGFEPEVSMSEGIKNVVQWYIDTNKI